MPTLQSIGLNDAVSSLRVGPGERWEVCERANYRGRCVVVSGSEADLRDSGWNDTISSARRLRGGGGGPQPPRPGGLELFSREGFEGDRRSFTGAQSDLRRLGFNDVARSLRLGRGQTWQVCVDANFVDCLVVDTSWSNLDSLGMSRRITSVRPWRSGGGNARSYVILFDEVNFRGSSQRIEREAASMGGFASRAESIQVTGGSWQLCERVNFGGRCAVVSGNVRDLTSIGLRNRVSSARPFPPPR